MQETKKCEALELDEPNVNTFKKKKKMKEGAPSLGVPHLHSNLGISPQRSSKKVSQPSPEMKKYLDFQ